MSSGLLHDGLPLFLVCCERCCGQVQESGKLSSLPPPPEEVGARRKRRRQGADDMPNSLLQMLELKVRACPPSLFTQAAACVVLLSLAAGSWSISAAADFVYSSSAN